MMWYLRKLQKREIYRIYPLHCRSYGIGCESPLLVPGNKTKTEAGIAIECMEDLEGAGYVKFEHNVACTHWQD